MSVQISPQSKGVNTINFNGKKVGVIYKQGQKDWATYTVYFTAVDFPIHSSSKWQKEQWTREGVATNPRLDAWVFLNSFSEISSAKRWVKLNFIDKTTLQNALFEAYKKVMLILNK